MISILEQMNKDPIRAELHFSRLGALSVKEALYKLQIDNVKTPEKQNNDYTDMDSIGMGIGTRVMAKILLGRVKNKVRSIVRNRLGI
jgi:hypothetical protein